MESSFDKCINWAQHLEFSDKSVYRVLEESAERHPKNKAYEFMGRTVDYSSFLQEVKRCSAAFAYLGVKAGDRVIIALPNIPQAILAFYGLNRLGAVPVMIHPLSAPNRILECIKENNCSVVVCFDMLSERFSEVGREFGGTVKLVLSSVREELSFVKKRLYGLMNRKKLSASKKLNNVITWKKFFNGKALCDAAVCDGGKDSLAAMIYSGGTSGSPKGVLLSNGNFNALSTQTNFGSGYGSICGMKMFALMPLSHGFGLGVGVHTALANGASCVLLPRFSPKVFAKTLIKSKPDFIFGVPTLFEAMLRSERLEKANLSFLKGVFCGGDSLSYDLKTRFDSFLAQRGATVGIREGYGASECLAVSCLTPKEIYRKDSVGLPLPGNRIKIVKPKTDEVLPCGELGEITLNGPTVMKGYMDEAEETALALKTHGDGLVWLHTGDLGFVDEEGFVYFKQRLKRMIISSGYNIYPSMLESVINSHPKVKESCVIGVRDSFKIQRVKAFVVPVDECDCSTEELKRELEAYFSMNISKYAIPKEIEFKHELPRTAVGKTDYRALEAEEAQKEA